jgi:predicted HicB family RNase H-like nuclease
MDAAEDWKHMQVRMPPSLIAALKETAKREMMSVAVFVRRALSDACAENAERGGKPRRPRA